MTTLIKGIMNISGVKIHQNLNLKNITEHISFSQVKKIDINDTSTAIRFIKPVQLGSKKFSVKIFFRDEVIKGIELKVDDPSIDEWDYRELMRQHGEWLEEQIGYPEGALLENKYSWGIINQWYDPRARDAGISILYN